MSIGYATQKGLTNSNPMRRWSQQVSYSIPPAPPGNNRRVGTAATLTSLTFDNTASAELSSTVYQFGTGSADLEAASAQIRRTSYNPTSTGAGTAPGGYVTGTGDFCIESWVYVPTGRDTTTGDLICLDTTGGCAIRFGTGYNSGTINNIQIFARGAADMDHKPYTWTRDTWTHWAVQRKSSVMTFWANGDKLTTGGGGSGGGAYDFSTSTADLVVGSYTFDTTDEDIKMYVDELCVSSSWRYDDSDSTYNVPTSPFSVDEYTRLLMHYDGTWASAAS